MVSIGCRHLSTSLVLYNETAGGDLHFSDLSAVAQGLMLSSSSSSSSSTSWVCVLDSSTNAGGPMGSSRSLVYQDGARGGSASASIPTLCLGPGGSEGEGPLRVVGEEVGGKLHGKEVARTETAEAAGRAGSRRRGSAVSLLDVVQVLATVPLNSAITDGCREPQQQQGQHQQRQPQGATHFGPAASCKLGVTPNKEDGAAGPRHQGMSALGKGKQHDGNTPSFAGGSGGTPGFEGTASGDSSASDGSSSIGSGSSMMDAGVTAGPDSAASLAAGGGGGSGGSHGVAGRLIEAAGHGLLGIGLLSATGRGSRGRGLLSFEEGEHGLKRQRQQDQHLRHEQQLEQQQHGPDGSEQQQQQQREQEDKPKGLEQQQQWEQDSGFLQGTASVITPMSRPGAEAEENLSIGGVHLALGEGLQSSGRGSTEDGGWWVAGEGAVLKGLGVEQQGQLYELGRQFGKGHFGEVWRAVSSWAGLGERGCIHKQSLLLVI